MAGPGADGLREKVSPGERAAPGDVVTPDGGAVLGDGVTSGGGAGLGDGVEEQVALGDGVMLQLARSRQLVESEPTAISLSGAPGMEWVAQRAWRGSDGELQLACARGPAGAWVSGMEAMLLDGASAVARKAAAAPSLQAQAAVRQGSGFRQTFTLGDDGQLGQGQHLLGFARDGDAVLVCTLLCRGTPSRCEPSLVSMQLSGQLAAEPTDTWPARTIDLLAAHPNAALAALIATLLLLTAWVLARRPRPRRG